ncbi:putative viral structural protein [Sulfolobales Beppu filamentous virus 2]|uniref:Putative viral structural protein n=1 Tax=Sulfolobales Beppu filamentous virus 2 TaxID=2493123 RepID=A0A3S8NEY8_9VIRU|nr:putative viral structural protein [Sulfolobales Beppu filamentous virus 2]AZI75808.1 putative viral structural protein [Sulfolobales Beppu filamentous virus 2]
MLYKGGLKFGSLDVDCNPCIVKGEYFMKDNVLIVSKGIVVFKDIHDIVIVTNDKVLRVPITAIDYMIQSKKEFSVVML